MGPERRTVAANADCRPAGASILKECTQEWALGIAHTKMECGVGREEGRATHTPEVALDNPKRGRCWPGLDQNAEFDGWQRGSRRPPALRQAGEGTAAAPPAAPPRRCQLLAVAVLCQAASWLATDAGRREEGRRVQQPAVSRAAGARAPFHGASPPPAPALAAPAAGCRLLPLRCLNVTWVSGTVQECGAVPQALLARVLSAPRPCQPPPPLPLTRLPPAVACC